MFLTMLVNISLSLSLLNTSFPFSALLSRWLDIPFPVEVCSSVTAQSCPGWSWPISSFSGELLPTATSWQLVVLPSWAPLRICSSTWQGLFTCPSCQPGIAHLILRFFPGKQFKCTVCDYTAAQKPHLLRHMEQHASFKVRGVGVTVGILTGHTPLLALPLRSSPLAVMYGVYSVLPLFRSIVVLYGKTRSRNIVQEDANRRQSIHLPFKTGVNWEESTGSGTCIRAFRSWSSAGPLPDKTGVIKPPVRLFVWVAECSGAPSTVSSVWQGLEDNVISLCFSTRSEWCFFNVFGSMHLASLSFNYGEEVRWPNMFFNQNSAYHLRQLDFWHCYFCWYVHRLMESLKCLAILLWNVFLKIPTVKFHRLI